MGLLLLATLWFCYDLFLTGLVSIAISARTFMSVLNVYANKCLQRYPCQGNSEALPALDNLPSILSIIYCNKPGVKLEYEKGNTIGFLM